MIKIFAVFSFLVGPAFSGSATIERQLGTFEFETRRECAEFLTANGQTIGLLRVRPIGAGIKRDGHLIYRTVIECKGG